MNPVILVMSGGAIGAALRYGLSRALPVNLGGWPWPTFAANLLGGLAMGLLAAWLVRGDGAAEPLRLFLGVGVLGGFTTFSAFSLEMAQMVQRGQGDIEFRGPIWRPSANRSVPAHPAPIP